MRAERKSPSHLVNLINIASGRSTMKIYSYVARLIPGFLHCCVHSMVPFHAGFPNNVIPHNIQIRILVQRNTYRSFVSISVMEYVTHVSEHPSYNTILSNGLRAKSQIFGSVVLPRKKNSIAILREVCIYSG